jgi:hypothetical protein
VGASVEIADIGIVLSFSLYLKHKDKDSPDFSVDKSAFSRYRKRSASGKTGR